MDTIDCIDKACGRQFLRHGAMRQHAEAVHTTLTLEAAELGDRADGEATFDDIEEMVRDAVREKYYQPSNYNASPPVPGVWAWVRDLSISWVVFEVEDGGDESLYQASYSILDGKVNLGEAVEVVRRTVYEPVKKES